MVLCSTDALMSERPVRLSLVRAPEPDGFLPRVGRSRQSLAGGTMAIGKPGAEVLESIPVSCAPSEVGNDAQSKWIAADAREVFTEQIGGSTDVAGRRCGNHFDVMAFPAHGAAAGGAKRCSGEGGEVGDGEPEVRIGDDRSTECRCGDGRVRRVLCLTVEGGGHNVGSDHPTVVLDRRTSRGRPATAGVGPFWVAVHE
jgi:hypothetical protein